MLAHFLPDAWRVLRICQSLNVPVAAVAHGSDALVRRNAASHVGVSAEQMLKNWERMVDAVDLFLPVSKFLERALVDRGVPTEKVQQHYLGVPIHEGIKNDRDDLRYDVGFIGRLRENKGYREFLKTVNGLSATLPKLRVLIAGDGPGMAEVEAWAEGMRTRVHTLDVLGSVPSETVPRLLASVGVVCCPSIPVESGAAEGLGLVALEAQQVGTPVVVYDTGGLPETLVPGRTGFVVTAGDTSAMVERVREILSTPNMRAAMGERGRSFVRSEFDLVDQTRSLEDVLKARVL
jgi:colanic acid/amylovoran biosynthesis glycosyltransferase